MWLVAQCPLNLMRRHPSASAILQTKMGRARQLRLQFSANATASTRWSELNPGVLRLVWDILARYSAKLFRLPAPKYKIIQCSQTRGV